MLKVLYLPLGNQKSTSDAFIEAGVNLQVYDFLSDSRNKNIVSEKLINLAKNFKPDLIHMQIQFTGAMSSETLFKVRQFLPNVKITNWTGDCRANPDVSFIELSKGCDYSLISSTGQIDLYKNAGCKNPVYWQIGYDPKINFPKNKSQFKYDISFIGSHYGHFPDSNLRYNTCLELSNKLGNKFGLFGSGYRFNQARSVPISSVNEIYNDSVCALSISHFNNVSHYFSDRLLYCLASGRPTISWNFPGYEDYFINGKDIIIVNNVNEIIDAINFCKSNPEKANEIGYNGWKKVFYEHSFASKIIELFNICGINLQ